MPTEYEAARHKPASLRAGTGRVDGVGRSPYPNSTQPPLSRGGVFLSASPPQETTHLGLDFRAKAGMNVTGEATDV